LYRLKRADYFGDNNVWQRTYGYTYDPVGNRKEAALWLPDREQPYRTNYYYNLANQLIGSGGDLPGADGYRSYSYDAAGNLFNITQDGNPLASYGYDVAGRLREVVQPGRTTSYLYNGLGDRRAQQVGTQTTDYLLDLSGSLTQVLGETVQSGAQTTYLPGLDIVGQQTNGQWSYNAYDGLGSLRQVTDSAGTTQYAANYDPYGGLLESYGTPFSSFGFTGEQSDANGLLYLRARYYDPKLGGFLARDPVDGVMARSNSRNGYSYVEGNPVNFTDHSGLCQDSISGTVLCPIQDVGMFFNNGLTRARQAAQFIIHNRPAVRAVWAAAQEAIWRDPAGTAIGVVNGVASATVYPILDAIWFGEEWLLSGQAEWGGIRRRITDATWSGAKRLGISDIRQNPGFQVGNFVGEGVGLIGDITQVPELLRGVAKLAKWGWNRAGHAWQGLTGRVRGVPSAVSKSKALNGIVSRSSSSQGPSGQTQYIRPPDSALNAPDLETALNEIERNIVTNVDQEYGAFLKFSDDERVILSFRGGSDNVNWGDYLHLDNDGNYFFALDADGIPFRSADILPDDVARVYTNGGTVTHNHPIFGDYGQSPADFAVGKTLDLAEHRMVRLETVAGDTSAWIYSAKPDPISGWGNFTKAGLKADFDAIEIPFMTQIDNYLLDTFGGRLSGAEYNDLFESQARYWTHFAGERAAEKYGFLISRSQLR
jgi:RHS repeat-associated protein